MRTAYRAAVLVAALVFLLILMRLAHDQNGVPSHEDRYLPGGEPATLYLPGTSNLPGPDNPFFQSFPKPADQRPPATPSRPRKNSFGSESFSYCVWNKIDDRIELHTMLDQLDRDLWTVRVPQRFLGAELGTRMTVVRLNHGGLWIHSPVKFDPSIGAELDALGRVRFVVAPNRFHHLYVAPYAEAFPEAKVFGAPGLDQKRKDLRFDAILDDSPPTEWVEQFDQVIFRAFPPLNEAIFFHRATRTLVLTDLLFNIRNSDSAWTRFLMTLDGGFGRAAVARSFRPLIKMRGKQARSTIERILAWDFHRILVTHGEAVEQDAKLVFCNAWSFL